MSEDMNELAAKQALADPKLQDFSWITKLPKNALNQLIELFSKKGDAEDDTADAETAKQIRMPLGQETSGAAMKRKGFESAYKTAFDE